MSVFDRLFSKKSPRDEFLKKVMEALSASGAREVHYNPEDGSIRVGSREATFYLDNAFADYSAAEREACSGVIQRYVSSFLQAAPTPKSFSDARVMLLPAVRDPAYFSLSLLMLRADGKDTSKLEYTTKSITNGLVACVALDSEHNIMNVNSATLRDWGVSFDEALEVAIMNLRDKTTASGLNEIAQGLYVSQWGDCYDSSRILLPDFLHRLSLSGDPVIFVPNRDQLCVTGKYNSAAIRAILTHGKESHFDQGHSLSPNLYVHSDGKWQPFLPDEEQLKKLSLSMRRQRDNIDYAQQKGYLEKLYAREKKDVFIATCQLFKRPDESLFSRCVWSNGVDSFLPEADFIVFMIDVMSKTHFNVRWDDAMPIVGSLMEKDPEFVPGRYRVRKFPDADQLAQLSKLAKYNIS
jgi:uncharacterized protein YtpQ (UPF0354 family)